ncbi:hypothetical protein [Clostridium pasteurianum]|uniref:Uncharacterized protein n=1 Tax=Clostridium pasteurianum BC1 TaxID=86416 RepID=R4K4Q3_CLOPA|nr:hypothetical protein [Clostridium pasteurianum]AGK96706.1 hypothetical protein Clopa_1798 [Clostridium pasteurianum BC1]
MNALQKINKCINKLENMTQDEFDAIVVEKNIDKKVYNEKDYVGEGFSILLPNKPKVQLIEKYVSNTIRFNKNNFSTSKNIVHSSCTINYEDINKFDKENHSIKIIIQEIENLMAKINEQKDNIFKDDLSKAA